jgi:hypothetical protein
MTVTNKAANSSFSFGAKLTFADGTTSSAVVYPNCGEMWVQSLDDSIDFVELHIFGVIKVDYIINTSNF